MFAVILRFFAIAFALLPAMAAAEPVTLKLAFFSSDRSVLYLAGVRPFVDAVNREAKDLVHIEVHFSSALGPVNVEPQLLLDGAADIAFMIPGYTPDIFFDDAVVELPGLFRSAQEATLVYSRLAAQNVFRSYEPFMVLGAFASEPQSLHSRKPIGSLYDIKGQKVRANNTTEATALAALGAAPNLLAINRTADAIAQGTIDAAMVPPAVLFEFGIGRVTTHHYMLRASSALMLLAMNRKSFERLPPRAQEVIRKYGGEWSAAQFIAGIEAMNAKNLQQIKTDSRRSLVFPSTQDSEVARVAFANVRKDWASRSAANAALLARLETEVAKIRSERSN